jgi:hypothetical protein
MSAISMIGNFHDAGPAAGIGELKNAMAGQRIFGSGSFLVI